ncbi:PAS domain S-box protein [Sphingomonas sp. SORGH_AS_0742]|nr:PAS domain S-box protein [Sphingomonas sp. SORGH_AS_0742]
MPEDEQGAQTASFLIAASVQLAAARSIDDVVDVLRRTARAAIGADGIAVIVRDGALCHYVAEDAIGPLWCGRRFEAGGCVSGLAMRHGATIAIADAQNDDRVPQGLYRDTFVRSMVIAPIGAPDPIAALGAYWSTVRTADAATIERLESLAQLATIAIENVRLIEARDRAADLAAAQSRILERVVRNAPLAETLDAIILTVERLSKSGVLGSVLLLDEDGRHLRHGAAPSLPQAYNEAIDGIAIGPAVGSCGSAVHRGEPVYVNDIMNDPLWADFRDLARDNGLHACWSAPIRSANGDVLGTFAMYHREPREPLPSDLEIVEFVIHTAGLVIERARGELIALRSEARYRQIVEGAEDFAIVTMDAKGVISGWNSGAERLTGYSREEALGQPGSLFYTEEDLAAGVFTAEMARARQEGRAVNERWHSRKTGERFWGSGLMMPLAMDHGGYVKMFRDRTAEHEADEARLESEALLRLATENAEVGFWDVEGGTEFLHWPPRTKAMFGISADAPVTMNDFYNGLHPDDAEATAEAYAAAADPLRRALYDVEYRTIGKEDGVVRWVAAKGRGVFDEQGRCIRVTGTAIDITARKAMELELRDLNETLEQRVGERTRELMMSQEALRQAQKMEAMGQLTGGVAHDFNNLLTPIVGSLDMLQRKRLGNEREQRLIAGAMQSAERAKTLVQRLLAFARRQPLQSVPVDIAQLVHGMGDLVSSTTGPQIKVVVEAATDLPPAMADPNQLEMALLNLSVNARDAMPDGGTLRISASVGRVAEPSVHGLDPGDYIRLSVADTGTGMDEVTLSRAVEPFFSTKGIGQGTGLGLSMVHGLASQLGGALVIHSRLEVGTNMELWLPQSAAIASPPEPKGKEDQVAPLSGRALLVDDEELVRLSTADMLADLGYEVIEASSAEQALRFLDDGVRVDLLVTDHLMPGMTGVDLAREVRQRSAETPILIVSGFAEVEGLDATLPRLIKPFRKDELASSIERVATTDR